MAFGGQLLEALTLASRMYECREALQFLHGDRYVELVAPWVAAIRRHQRISKKSTLAQTIDMATCKVDDHAVMWLLAAAVDLMHADADGWQIEEKGPDA